MSDELWWIKLLGDNEREQLIKQDRAKREGSYDGKYRFGEESEVENKKRKRVDKLRDDVRGVKEGI